MSGRHLGARSMSVRTMIIYILALIGAYAVLSTVLFQGLPLRAASLRKAVDTLKRSFRRAGHQNLSSAEPVAESGPRGNDYVNEDGVLPYQRCGASDFSPGPQPLFGVIKMNGTRYDQVVLGATVWGESDSTGKPTRVDKVQLLFFTQSQESKCESVHYAAHCYLPEVLPTVSCRIGGKGAPWHKAYREKRVLDIWSTVVGRQNVASDPVQCPFTGGVEALADRFEVALRIGEDDDREGVQEPTFVFDMCYTHVEKASDVTICTQPQFLYSTTAGYWVGKPPFSNYTILDGFLLYHMELMGTSLAIYDVQTSVEAALEPYRHDGRVVYRPNWGLYEIQRKHPDKPYNPYGYQTQCETACFWEQRIRARWVFFLHSADCYVLPSNPGETFVGLLKKINRTQVSEIRIPTVEAHSPPDVPFEGNILRRFSLLGRGGLFKQKRFTPLGNPRHFDASNVHVFTANHTTAKASLGTRECIFDYNLRTVHIYAAARSNSDAHRGRLDERWIRIGHELEALLAQDYPRRAKYRELIAAETAKV